MASQSRASGLEDLTHIRYRTIVGREDVMLTRPGSTPGSGWMRDLSERLAAGPADPSGFRSLPRSYWLSYIALMVMIVVVAPMTFRQATPPGLPVNESATRSSRFPLLPS